MKIGLTYDLRDDYLAAGYSTEETAEFDRQSTIDSLENALNQLGYETDCIGHAKHLIIRLAQGDRWDMVFNIAEGMYGLGREALVPAALDAYQIPYTFSEPLVLALSLHKGATKRVIRDLGIPTPGFAVIETEAEIANVALEYPLFAKPIAEGTGKGIDGASKIRTAQQLRRVCRKLLHTYQQPVLVETFLPGREFTVGIVGTGSEAKALGVLEVVLNGNAEQDAYSYENKERCEELVEYRLADDEMAAKAIEVAIAAWNGLGCRDGGRVDLRADAEGQPQFIEVNPLAGLHPEHSDLPILATLTGMSYLELIETIMQSALRRAALWPVEAPFKKAA